MHRGSGEWVGGDVVGVPVGLAPVEHLNDVRMVQLGGRRCLAPKAFDERRIGGVAVRQNLDRHPNYILAAYMASGT